MMMSGSALKSAMAFERLDMAAPASRADLAIGMQLLRASNMKAVRLQLALFRRDRTLALEAIDGLVDLDAEIASFIADMPPPAVSVNEMDDIAVWIDEQKRAIASEKLALVCGADGPGVVANQNLPLSKADEDDSQEEPETGEDEDGAMNLGGFEIGAKRIRAEIEDQAFRAAPAKPADIESPVHFSPVELRKLAAIEANARELQIAVADIDERLHHIPGKGFILMTVLSVQAILAWLIVYGDAIRPLVPLGM